MIYDTVIVGGGFAGLQAAIQLGRYSAHRILVVDKGAGRSSICRSYHNILGFPDGISGEELRSRGRLQAERAGVLFATDTIIKAGKQGEQFELEGAEGKRYKARTVLLATGIMDRYPSLPGLTRCLGRSVYVCPDCDGFEIQGRKTVLLGSGTAGYQMALILAARTDDLTYLNHERQPLSAEQLERLESLGVRYLEQAAAAIEEEDDGMLTGVRLESGERLEAERGFIAFGGNTVHSELAEQLGLELHKNKHVEADSRSLTTNVEGVWIAGDLGVHAEQATVAMGEGAIAAIWINKHLQRLKGTDPFH
ncbi:NAD(P)/FAD-dependent oxidoreductase [Paenibacillus spiritus]|uniref:NAD(P)/FAD-dependent oxidoreductase n=1 Tax=Paenibacillus spiritus TaxID=2496557 RepID=A0A5J5G5H0_9BACL|nr:NAD(P)/FAD-dependent oxidoreductase [Paenibacillus spiritus]KAA9002342.1 NAD(P)/FAD-dependent oxidoreductase [Paenibacillus spiritus]